MLSSTTSKPLIILYGQPGVGKTALVAQVFDKLACDEFPGGILWGNLDNYPPSELLIDFLARLDNQQVHHRREGIRSLRDIFWTELHDKRALIVLDRVRDPEQLGELLPARVDKGPHQVLVICERRFEGSLFDPEYTVSIGLNPFTAEQSLQLFNEYYCDAHQIELHQHRLLEIAELLGQLPYLLDLAARELSADRVSPNDFLQILRSQEERTAIGHLALLERLDSVLRGLAKDVWLYWCAG